MASPSLLRGVPLLRLRLHLNIYHCIRLHSDLLAPHRRQWFTSAVDSNHPGESLSSADDTMAVLSLNVKDPPTFPTSRLDETDFRRWKDVEQEIFRDINPIVLHIKDILHSYRYKDGECLTGEDEEVVVERLLAYHPHSEDKIGCGLHFIMVDRHPQFRHSRCLFVIRSDGSWIDFSYQKCLREYIRQKYPSLAERFIREHLKRGSG